VLDIDADDPALGIEVDHQTVLNLAGIHTGASVQIDIERVRFLVINQLHAHPFLRRRRGRAGWLRGCDGSLAARFDSDWTARRSRVR